MVITRDVTPEECPWLPQTLHAGTEVFRYYGYDYGCVSPNGVPVTLEAQDELPFYEVPRDAVGWADVENIPEAA